MDQNLISLLLALVALLVSFYCFYLINDFRKRQAAKGPADNFNTRPLQLQAYERLVMLSERIAIPNLISRVNTSGISAREMQLLLLESIKQEYEYNTSQQIYVSPVAWEAVRNLKEQNMLIINQVAATLPPEAGSADLNKRLLEFIMTQSKGALHSIVLEALNFEAKKVMR
ncbi:MAG: hypothetical protein KA821_17575 [Chitinophagaceae bacterium]|nr:hypothetical protein [Chitinophagaceae bacterium]